MRQPYFALRYARLHDDTQAASVQACSARSELAQGHWADEQALMSLSLRQSHLAAVCFQPCTGLQALAAADSVEPLRLGVHESQHQEASYCLPVESPVSWVLAVWVV